MKQAASLNTARHYFALSGGLGLFNYFRYKIWRHILARRPRFPIKVTKFRAYLA